MHNFTGMSRAQARGVLSLALGGLCAANVGWRWRLVRGEAFDTVVEAAPAGFTVVSEQAGLGG